MQTATIRGLPSRSARVRAALTALIQGSVFEIPNQSIRERYMSPTKVIVWKHNGRVELRTYDESKTKETPRWSLDAEGRLLDNGITTTWWAYDLRPTGQNALLDILDSLPNDDDEDEVPSTHGRIIPLRRVGEQAL